MRSVALGSACALALACQPAIELQGRECPCIEGWRCNPALGESGRCVEEVSLEFEPTHAPGGLVSRGFSRVEVDGAHWVIDTDDGSIRSYPDLAHGGEGTLVRDAGEGVVDGIGFAVTGGAYGVFSFESLAIEPTASVVAVGARPLLLLILDEARIAGLLSAGADRMPDRPGAGGYRGVDPLRAGCTSTPPVGPFGSGRASQSGGGGGGTFGSCGAAGAAGPGACRGGPGQLDPTLAADPWFRGGVGGAPGGAGSCSLAIPGDPMRPRGGHGGGALQISAGVGIYVLEGGVIDARGGGGGGGDAVANAASAFDVAAGGGGGSGGVIFLEAPTITVAGAVTAAGGGGGAGGGYSPSMSVDGEPGEPGRIDGAPAAGGRSPFGEGGGAGSDILGVTQPGRQTVTAQCGDGCMVRGGGGGGGAGVIVIRSAVDAPFPEGLGFTSPAAYRFAPLDGPVPALGDEWPACQEVVCTCECRG